MQRRKLPTLIIVSLILIGWGCDYISRSYEADEQKWRETVARIGIARNSQRIQLEIPILPDSGWTVFQRKLTEERGYVSFINSLPGVDSMPRHALKQVYFDMPNFQPVLEVDSYYSGRMFTKYDPESLEWERVALFYSYNSGKAPATDYYYKDFKKGKNAVLFGGEPIFTTSNSNPKGGYVTNIIERPISLVQADSVLKAWHLSTVDR